MICPEMYAARSEARKAIRSATSSGLPARFIGSMLLIVSLGKVLSVIGEMMMPGATALTVMPRLASSSASDLVAPGIIVSPMTESTFPKETINSIVPMKRAGKPEEVADLIAFLASDRAAYISGQIISINGAMA